MRLCFPSVITGTALLLGLLTAHIRADILYVSDAANNSIEKFTSNGTASFFTATGLNGPRGIAFDTSGNLYAANFSPSTSGTIEKFTSHGVGSVFSNGSNFQEDLAFDSAGNLYEACGGSANGEILKITPGGTSTVFFVLGGVSAPIGLAFDGAGNLYVSNENSNTIEEITPNGVGSVFFDTGLDAPFGLAFDSAGNLYVSNLDSNTIEKIDPTGIGTIFASTGLDKPTGLAFDSAGNLYAANATSDTIEEFTPGGVGSVFANTGLSQPEFLAFTNNSGQPLQLPPTSIPEPSIWNLVVALCIPTLLGLRRRSMV